MVEVSMHSLSSGKRAYLTTQLQNKVFTSEQAAKYAKEQWNIDVDIGSIEAYMKGEPDPLVPQSIYTDVHELPETVISSALAKDLEAVGKDLTLVKHQYELESGNRIDVLCKDKDGKWVVIEVKKSATRDVLDQLLSYMAELKEQHPEDAVKGIVMSNSYDADLDRKIRLLAGSGIELRYYKLKVLPSSEEEVMKT
jgi:RecB family endonuclease NucS